MITTVNHILDALFTWAPHHLKADYDNIGLLVGDPNQTVTQCVICLDLTEAVIEEAIRSESQLIIAHHPIIFRKLAQVRADDPTGYLLTLLIRNHISVIAMHTNLDSAMGGVSYVLAEKIGLDNLHFLDSDREEGGYGVIGELKQVMNTPSFLSHCADRLGVPMLRYTGSPEQIHRVAVCGGSGAFLTDQAIKKGAQAYITADLKYHDFFTHTSSFLLCDAGHYETEMPICGSIQTFLAQHFPRLSTQVTQVVTNPIHYHIQPAS
jgi:dinuclear metal center YbgI/SA1388 family protein